MCLKIVFISKLDRLARLLTDPSFANFPTLSTQPSLSFSFSYLKLFWLSGISITSKPNI